MEDDIENKDMIEVMIEVIEEEKRIMKVRG